MRVRVALVLWPRYGWGLLTSPRSYYRIAKTWSIYRQPPDEASLLDSTASAELIRFWLHDAADYWFSSTDAFDRMVAAQWCEPLVKSLQAHNETSVAAWAESAPADMVFAHVLLWDQISRHCARVSSQNRIAEAAKLAMPCARALIDRVSDWPTARQCFTLMPLRHSFEPIELERTLQLAEVWKAQPGSDVKMWRRFQIAATRALLRVNTERVTPAVHGESAWSVYEHVLEPSVQTTPVEIEEAWQRRYKSGAASCIAYKAVRKWLATCSKRRLIVSVSGGVDSMLLLSLIKRILDDDRPRRMSSVCSLAAAHVNYGNRLESNSDADFVQAYCSWMGVELFRRDLSEVHRQDDMLDRAEYEQITRETRFALYKRAAGECFFDGDFAVVLGHNRNDCWENLFTNINKGQHYDELRGMCRISTEFQCTTMRPLLDITKAEIYDAARQFKIPHCKDSTDPQCERGQLRDKWLPLVAAQQPMLIPGLERVADHLSFLHRLWRERVNSFWDHECRFDGDKLILPIQAWIVDAPSEMLWVEIFNKLAAHTKRPRPSNKSLRNFHAWLSRAAADRRSSRTAQCNLSRDYEASFNSRDSRTVHIRVLRNPSLSDDDARRSFDHDTFDDKIKDEDTKLLSPGNGAPLATIAVTGISDQLQ